MYIVNFIIIWYSKNSSKHPNSPKLARFNLDLLFFDCTILVCHISMSPQFHFNSSDSENEGDIYTMQFFTVSEKGRTIANKCKITQKVAGKIVGYLKKLFLSPKTAIVIIR